MGFNELVVSCEEVFEEFWRPLVCDASGDLDPDKVKRELFDYWVCLQEVPKVYDEVTGGRYSKPTTMACFVIEAAYDRFAAAQEDNDGARSEPL